MESVESLSDAELQRNAHELHERINVQGIWVVADLELMNSVDCELEARGYEINIETETLSITKGGSVVWPSQ